MKCVWGHISLCDTIWHGMINFYVNKLSWTPNGDNLSVGSRMVSGLHYHWWQTNVLDDAGCLFPKPMPWTVVFTSILGIVLYEILLYLAVQSGLLCLQLWILIKTYTENHTLLQQWCEYIWNIFSGSRGQPAYRYAKCWYSLLMLPLVNKLIISAESHL